MSNAATHTLACSGNIMLPHLLCMLSVFSEYKILSSLDVAYIGQLVVSKTLNTWFCNQNMY